MMLEVFGHYHHHPLHKASTEFDPKRYDCGNFNEVYCQWWFYFPLLLCCSDLQLSVGKRFVQHLLCLHHDSPLVLCALKRQLCLIQRGRHLITISLPLSLSLPLLIPHFL